MRRQALGEFLGTALMVGVGCGSVMIGASHGVVSLAFGAAVTVAILVFGPLSGAHINPAVSVAFWRDGQLDGRMVPAYLVAQFLGALTGSFLVSGAAPTSVSPSLTLFEGFAVEVVITACLMASILLVVFIAGPWTGASMNPARTFGPNLLNGDWASLPFYFVSTALGAWLACDIKNRYFPD
jgi:glycerol uptake facilitator-like aquaporin